MVTLGEYVQELRTRVDDDPFNGDSYFKDEALIRFINNARRKISHDLNCYEQTLHIFPALHKDEASLPADYLIAGDMIDVINQIKLPPTSKTSAETTKNWYAELIRYANLAYINETRKTITFFAPFQRTQVEPYYAIKEFDRANGRIVIDGLSAVSGTGTAAVTTGSTALTGTSTKFLYELSVGDTITIGATTYTISSITDDVTAVLTAAAGADNSGAFTISHYTLANIMDWDLVKAEIQISNTNGELEYARVSKVEKTATAEYTLHISAWDTKKEYKNSMTLRGTFNVNTLNVHVYGAGANVNVDLAVGDLVTFYGQHRTVSAIANANYFNVNSAFTTTALNKTINVSNMVGYGVNDYVRFASYQMYYYAKAKDLQYYSETDNFQLEVTEIVPILASVECWMRKSNTQKAQLAMQEYYQRLEEVKGKLNAKSASAHNRAKVTGGLF